jgi:plastocyanin
MQIRLCILLAALLALAACNGDGNGDDGDAGNGAAGDASTSIQASATEFAFDPDSWTVPAGEPVTLDFTNDGDIEHEWVIIEQGTTLSATEEFEEDHVVWEIEAAPGETETGEFTVDEAGTYQVVCAIEGHLDAGMEGTLEVTEG